MKNERGIFLGKENTDKTRVLEFLDEFKDPNYLHQQGIMPGMFYLFLVEPKTKKEVKSINIDFKEFAIYPLDLNLFMEDIGNGFKFKFYDNNKLELCEGVIEYGSNSSKNNNKKFRKVYEIGGRLQEEFRNNRADLFREEDAAMYVNQSMAFDNDFINNPSLNIGNHEKLDKRRFRIETSYLDNNEVISEGHANVTIVPKKVLNKTLERLLSKSPCVYHDLKAMVCSGLLDAQDSVKNLDIKKELI